MTLTELVADAHGRALRKGWYDGEAAHRNVPEMLALIHSEISEALEAYRNAEMTTAYSVPHATGPAGYDLNGNPYGAASGAVVKPDGFPIELADAVIRIADLCGYLGIDLDAAVREKSAYNETRPHRHGGKRA